MTLTKSQRHIAYIIMLAELEYGSQSYFCHIMSYTFDFPPTNRAMSLYFPELYAKRPPGKYAWFPSYETKKRIKIIKKCIEETY